LLVIEWPGEKLLAGGIGEELDILHCPTGVRVDLGDLPEMERAKGRLDHQEE